MSNLPTYLPYAKLAQVVEDQFLLGSTEGLQVSVNGGNPHSYHDLCVTGTTLADVCEKRCGNTVVVQDRHQDFNIHIPDLVSMKYWWLRKIFGDGPLVRGSLFTIGDELLLLCPDTVSAGLMRVMLTVVDKEFLFTPFGPIPESPNKWNLAWDTAHFLTWDRPKIDLRCYKTFKGEVPHVILDFGKQLETFYLHPYRQDGTRLPCFIPESLG